jgi:hypothetical protein
MAARLVVGVYAGIGVALDAYHRLHTEGFPQNRLGYRVLKEVGPVPQTTEPELQALQIDPMVLGDARQTFVRFIRNGETAVFVQAEDDGEAEAATDILRLYAPLAVETLINGGGGQQQSHPVPTQIGTNSRR